jgi:hypothetical protein
LYCSLGRGRAGELDRSATLALVERRGFSSFWWENASLLTDAFSHQKEA